MLTYSQESGSRFPLGDTRVSVEGTDEAGNRARRGCGCGATSGAQAAGWSGLLLRGWLRARRRRTP